MSQSGVTRTKTCLANIKMKPSNPVREVSFNKTILLDAKTEKDKTPLDTDCCGKMEKCNECGGCENVDNECMWAGVCLYLPSRELVFWLPWNTLKNKLRWAHSRHCHHCHVHALDEEETVVVFSPGSVGWKLARSLLRLWFPSAAGNVLLDPSNFVVLARSVLWHLSFSPV